jgi:xylulose-5-phosphate/fructose-6-phosphate phosphoketolase
METLAAVMLLHEAIPSLKIRTVNVVDLLALQDAEQYPHGLEDADFDRMFTPDKPVIFAYHGYPYLIHRLTYRRNNHENIHVRGFIEEGTTPFDMMVINQLDRYHLALEAIARIPGSRKRCRRCCKSARQTRGTRRFYSRAWRGHARDQELEMETLTEGIANGTCSVRVAPKCMKLFAPIDGLNVTIRIPRVS